MAEAFSADLRSDTSNKDAGAEPRRISARNERYKFRRDARARFYVFQPPGETFELEYSIAHSFSIGPTRLQVGGVGYEQRQTSATTGTKITPEESRERYAVNALGFSSALAIPNRRLSLGIRFFEEFANRATFQGYSVQISGSIGF